MMHTKYMCSVHRHRLTDDRHVQITDPGGIRANECHKWLDLWG